MFQRRLFAILTGVLFCLFLISSAQPVMAAEESMQVLMLRKMFASPVDAWNGILEDHKDLLDTSFFQRVEARIRWSVDNGQIDDALRFAYTGDAAGLIMKRKTNYRLQLSQLFRHRGNLALAADIVNNILINDKDNKEAKFYKASLMHDSGAALDAYPIYQELYDEGVRKAECAYRMALIDIQKQDELLAMKRLQEAVKLDPQHDLAKIELAKLEKFINNATFAPPVKDNVNDKGGAIPLSTPNKTSKSVDMLLADANFSLASQDPAKAIALCNEAIALDNTCAKAYIKAGTIHFQQGEIEQALAYFTKATQFNPHDCDLLRYLGLCHEMQYDANRDKRDLARANDYYKQAQSLNPNHELLHFDLTRAEQKINNA